jgi:hypothetical protein
MKRKITYLMIAFVVCIASHINSQSVVWKFGNLGGLKFNSNGTTSTHSGSYANGGGGATGITDQSGNLIFYTDGKNLWDGNNALISSALMGSILSTQSPVIVPVPGQCNKYMIFTIGSHQPPSPTFGACWVEVTGTPGNYTISATVPGGLIFSNSWEEKLAVVPDGDSPFTGYWLFAHRFGNQYYSWHITSSNMAGISSGAGLANFLMTNPIIQTGNLSQTGGTNSANAKGQMKFNKAGTLLAAVVSESRQVEIYNFNKTNGVISFLKSFTLPVATAGSSSSNIYGLEFSPNGSLLYVSEGYHALSGVQKRVFQVNFASSIPTYTVLAATNSLAANENTYNALQLGPNDKIYLSGPREGNSAISVINSPNTLGTGASFSANSVAIAGTNNTGLPAAIPGYVFNIPTPLTVSPTSVSMCTPQSVTFNASGGVAYAWDPNGETTSSITVTPTTTTTYTIYALLSNGCQVNQSVTANVGVVVKPTLVSTAYYLCPGTPTATMSLAGPSNYYAGATYQWQYGDCNSLSDVPTATGSTHSVTNPYGQYRVKVGCGTNTTYSNQLGLYYLSSCSLSPPSCTTQGGGGGGCILCRSNNNAQEIANDENIMDALNIYPNPTSGQFMLLHTSSTEGNALISIVNMYGSEVIHDNHFFEKGENKIQMDLSDFSKGIYFVKITGENKQLVFKLSYQ